MGAPGRAQAAAKVQPGLLHTRGQVGTALCRDTPGPPQGPSAWPSTSTPSPDQRLTTAHGSTARSQPPPKHETHSCRGCAPGAHKAAGSAQEGRRAQAKRTGHLLGPASLPPSLGAHSRQPGTPDDALQLRAQCGPGTCSLNTDHRPQGVPRLEPRGPRRVCEVQQDAHVEDAVRPTAWGWHGAGALQTRMWPPAPPLGGVQPLYPASDRGTQHPRGQRRARALSSAPGSLGTSSPGRKRGQRQWLGKPIPGSRAALPAQLCGQGLGRSLPGRPHHYTDHPGRSRCWRVRGHAAPCGGQPS